MVPDSDSVGGAAEGTKSPSTSGSPAPDTSMKNVLGLHSFDFDMANSHKTKRARPLYGIFRKSSLTPFSFVCDDASLFDADAGGLPGQAKDAAVVSQFPDHEERRKADEQQRADQQGIENGEIVYQPLLE